jgi:predicted AlkP superfamily phosphohydrolase/phosphomutase
MTKILLFGIDGAAPELIFDKWLDYLPNIKRLIQKGSYAKLNSTIPPSTIIAWNAMISGKDPSEIGVFSYTFKDAEGNSRLVTSKNRKCRLIWDVLREQGKKAVSLYVPLSFPVNSINDGNSVNNGTTFPGSIVSGFLTPSVESDCTYPLSLKKKIKQLGNPDIFFDVASGLASHKELDISKLVENAYKMTEMQITLLKDLLVNEEWDVFMSVMLGSDRLQHMLWRHFDETHRRHIKESPHKNVLRDYYIYLDKQLGEIIELLERDTEDFVIIVASDHGMVKQEGKININNWLIKEGYLVLKEDVDLTSRKRFKNEYVDLEKSVAWGGGAYNARIFINRIKGSDDYHKIREEIKYKLLQIPDDNGNKIDTKVYFADEIYVDSSSSECPDLTVYFDDLRWASNPDLGQEGLYSWHSAVGADSAGHSRQGCFIISGRGIPNKSLMEDLDIKQVAPTILKLLNIPIPQDIKVSPIDLE